MTSIRFIHAADLHLDSPFKGMTDLPLKQLTLLRESTFAAFDNLIHYACEEKVDFVCFVGDIYDGEDRSLQAQLKFQQGMEKLEKEGIPAIVSYGNHDHLNGRWTRFKLPSNVYAFGEEVSSFTLQIKENDVYFYGFSYKNRHVRESMIEQYPIANVGDDFHIGLLHGSLAGDDSHAVYAPFTKAELLEKQYDYWALGHIHLRQILHENPHVVYSGNIQGRHRKEVGAKGFYDVELTKKETALKFVESSSITFERIEVSCKGIRHANEWLQVCEEELQKIDGSCIVELHLVDIDEETAELFAQSPEEEWLNVLREVMNDNAFFKWVQSITFQQSVESRHTKGTLVQPVISQIESWTDLDWKDVLKEVYQHPHAVKYLDVLAEEDIAELKEHSIKVLHEELLNMK